MDDGGGRLLLNVGIYYQTTQCHYAKTYSFGYIVYHFMFILIVMYFYCYVFLLCNILLLTLLLLSL
jgi:hypothetical protein